MKCLKKFTNKNLHFQLRKAIEDVNSGNLVPKSSLPPQVEQPATPITPCSEPLLLKTDKEVNNTVTSIDSMLQSNSDAENYSTDIELENLANAQRALKS